MTCPTCNGFRRIRIAAGACEPEHDADCPTCVGYLVPGSNGVRMLSTIPPYEPSSAEQVVSESSRDANKTNPLSTTPKGEGEDGGAS